MLTELRKHTSTHQVYKKIYIKNKKKRFTNYIPIHINLKILNTDETDLVIDERLNDGDVEKSGTEMETYLSIEELKNPQEYEDGGIFFLDD